MEPNRSIEMWRLRGELRELRSAWRQEFRIKLEQIEDPGTNSWFERWFSTQKSIDRRISSGICQGEAEVALIEYTMRLEHVLAVGSLTVEEFQDSLDSELEQLDQLHSVLQEKAAFISGKRPDISVMPVVERLSALITAYRELLPRALPGS